MDMTNWQHVLESIRQANRTPGGWDMRPYWRAQAYLAHEGEPEPIVRAHAFANVLRSARIHLYEGEQICGSRLSWLLSDLPADVTEADYAQLKAVHDARGQRDFTAGFDHSLADYPTLLSRGIGGLIDSVRQSMMLDCDQAESDFLGAVLICLMAFSEFVARHAEAARAAGRDDLAETLDRIVIAAPRTLHEAMQLVWLTHIAFSSEGRCHMALGRIDQYLWWFYDTDCQRGSITRDQALDLFCHLWVRLEEIQEVQNICIGGLTPEGKDATNELSYICLEATRLVQSPHTNLSARLHDDSPDEFHEACFDVIRTGVGFPAIFNDHVLTAGLMEIGIPSEVALDYCMVGCIETMLAGRQQAWSDSRFNMPLHLMQALEGLRGQSDVTFDRVVSEFKARMTAGIADHVAAVNGYIANFPPDRFPDPFLSALTRGCIDRGRDINDGGAEFERFHGIAVMGLATTSDSLAALKKLVFEDGQIPFDQLMQALDSDFAENEPLRQLLLNRPPKYGNDDPYVDSIAADLVDWTSRECLRHEVHGGGRFMSAMAANVSNIPAGKEVGATPDGRRAFTPLSDAASPYFGRDKHGPTAFLNSVAAPDYHLVLSGSVINMKFDPEHFEGEEGRRYFTALTKAFVAKRIPELQFNFTGNATLEAAQRNPEHYGNLVVRVSGFSAYFTRLEKEVQNDVIRRRAHSELS